MKVLVLGSGGREHALVWSLSRSPSVEVVYCAPGNGGTSALATNVDLAVTDPDAVRRFAEEHGIDLVVPGPESLISLGITDAFDGSNTRVFAPGQEAARLESSKVFGARFRRRHGIPSPRFFVAEKVREAYASARRLIRESGGVAIKADGLCAGKGVLLAEEPEKAHDLLKTVLEDRRFGEAGARVVLEEFVAGEEISVLALLDGHKAVPLLPSQDYKKLLDGNEGPNTGGMGAYAPVRWCGEALLDEIQETVLEPTVAGLIKEGLDFRGVLYAGLILSPRGPLVLEYNVRFGDPETQAILPLLESDLAELMSLACQGSLPSEPLRWKSGAAVCVVQAAGGYPSTPETGQPIDGIEQAEEAGAIVFHAATRQDGGRLWNSGGRVLGVTAYGESVSVAAGLAYEAGDAISFPGQQCRRDIARIGNGPGSRRLSALRPPVLGGGS